MITLDNIFYRVADLLGKDQYGKYVNPRNFNQNLIWCNLQLMDKYIKEFEATREVSTNLRPFFKTLGTPEDPKLVLDSRGRALMPDDYYYYSSGYTSAFLNVCGGYTETQNMLEWVDNETFRFRIDRDMATADYPIITYTTIKQSDGSYLAAVEVFPVKKAVSITYLRRPIDPVFGYTTTGGTVIYDPTTSTAAEWPESALDDFIELMVQCYARSIQDQFSYQVSNAQEAKQQ